MKVTLSFLKPVNKGLNWIGQGLVMFWRVYKYSFFPTEKNLLISFWWDFVHFKNRIAGATVYDFLDDRRIFLKRVQEDPELSGKKKQLYRDLLEALHRPRLRKIFIDFLESPSPEENYQLVINAMKSAWRSDEEVEPVALLPEVAQPKVDPPNDRLKLLNAKAYYIAASLYFELKGMHEDFKSLSFRLNDLKEFVKVKFHVTKLPGTFDDLKNYRYEDILKGKNESRKAQLKPHFRQIIENPGIFGEAIADRAREIMDEYFI